MRYIIRSTGPILVEMLHATSLRHQRKTQILMCDLFFIVRQSKWELHKRFFFGEAECHSAYGGEEIFKGLLSYCS